MNRSLLLLLVFAAACSGGSSGPRYQSKEDGVSFARLDGWEIGRERATLVFRRAGLSATIAIRSTPRDGWSEPRDAVNVFSAVETVLSALPHAHVSGPFGLDDPEYPAVAFDVDYAPSGRRHYQRRHVTLVGDSRIIHVFLVAPAGQLDSSRRDLDRLVNSIAEEG